METGYNALGKFVPTLKDTMVNGRDRDSDGDGLEDSMEIDPTGDADHDGIKNVNDIDSDNDYLADGDEPLYSSDSDKDGTINVFDKDSDNDGLLDGVEAHRYRTANIEISDIQSYRFPLVDTSGDITNFQIDNSGNLFIVVDNTELYRLNSTYHDSLGYATDNAAMMKLILETTDHIVDIAVNASGELFIVTAPSSGSGSTLHRLHSNYSYVNPTENANDLVTIYHSAGYVLKGLTLDPQGNAYFSETGMIKTVDANTTTVRDIHQALPYGDALFDMEMDGSGRLIYTIQYGSTPIKWNTRVYSDFDRATSESGVEYTILDNIQGEPGMDLMDIDGSGNILFRDVNDGKKIHMLTSGYGIHYASKNKEHLVEVNAAILPNDALKVGTNGDLFSVMGGILTKVHMTQTDPTKTDSDRDGLSDGFDQFNKVNSDSGYPKGVAVMGATQIRIWNFTGTSARDTFNDTDGIVRSPMYAKVQSMFSDPTMPLITEEKEKQIPSSAKFIGYLVLGELSHHNSFRIYKSNMLKADSDGDGLLDGMEGYGSTLVLKDWINPRTSNETVQQRYDIHANSNPLAKDTDNDGLDDNLEYMFTDALDKDTDNDGISDYNEDANHNGICDGNETSPLNRDTDNDGLVDGYLDGGEGTFVWAAIASGELSKAAPDWNVPGSGEWGENDIKTAIPAKNLTLLRLTQDSDGDKVPDGVEFMYLWILKHDPFHNSDGTGEVDIFQADSDSDGLTDGQENWDWNAYISWNATGVIIEPNATDHDTDGDGLWDGAEPAYLGDSDNDTKINSRDRDSNEDNTWDYWQVFVTFRTGAMDRNGDGKLDYYPGDWVVVDMSGEANTTTNLTAQWTLDLARYGFTENVTSLPGGVQHIRIGYLNLVNNTFGLAYINVTDSNDREIWATKPGSYVEDVYINVSTSPSNLLYAKFTGRSNLTDGISDPSADDYIYSQGDHVRYHEESYDFRLALNCDVDFDGLNNTYDPNNFDRDTDDDGVMDGNEPGNNQSEKAVHANDPDSDNDGLNDGVEMGITSPVPGLGGGINGTNTSSPNYKTDADPSTRTDPLNPDTDADGIPDGVEDANHNGRWDRGSPETETNPLDSDTDDDGLVDGADRVLASGGDPYNPSDWGDIGRAFNVDSDNDGILDGTEEGITLGMLTAGTNLDVSTNLMHKLSFIPDADPSCTTSHILVDTDGDLLSDGWCDGKFINPSTPTLLSSYDGRYDIDNASRYDWWEGEDINHDGKQYFNETNATEPDSDHDGLWDGPDVGSHFGERNAKGRALGGGFTQKNDTDPLNHDSDADGLWDGDELLLVNYDGIDNPKNYKSDPSVFDTDGDQLSDGQEIQGWTVTIIWEKTKDKKEQRHVTSNPLVVDTDNDGLNDYNEFLNSSDPQVRDTDGDHISDCNETASAQWQIEGKDPTLWKVEAYKSAGSFFGPFCVNIVVGASDNAGLDKVIVRLLGTSHPAQTIMPCGDTNITHTFTFKVELWELDKFFISGFDANITVSDVNANGAYNTIHVDSVLETVVKAIISAIVSFVKAIADAISKVFEWIWGVIKGMLDIVFAPIITAITSWFNSILERIKYYQTHSSAEGLANDIALLLFGGGVFLAVFALVLVLTVINTLTKVFTFGGADLLLDAAIPIITGIIVGSLVVATVLTLATGAESFKDLIPPEVNSGIFVSFNLFDFIFYAGLAFAAATRPLKTASEVWPMGLVIAILGLILLATKIFLLTSKDKNTVGWKIVIDIALVGIYIWAFSSLKMKGYLKQFYGLLYPIEDAFGIIGLVGAFSELIIDTRDFIVG